MNSQANTHTHIQQEVMPSPTRDTGTPVGQEVANTQEVQVRSYSQDVMDFQGKANGLYTLAFALLILVIAVSMAVRIGWAIKENDPTILAPPPEQPQIEMPIITI